MSRAAAHVVRTTASFTTLPSHRAYNHRVYKKSSDNSLEDCGENV